MSGRGCRRVPYHDTCPIMMHLMLPTDTDTRLLEQYLPQTSSAGGNSVSGECDLLPVMSRGFYVCETGYEADHTEGNETTEHSLQKRTETRHCTRQASQQKLVAARNQRELNPCRSLHVCVTARPIYPVPSPGLPSPPPAGYCCGRYASYWGGGG